MRYHGTPHDALPLPWGVLIHDCRQNKKLLILGTTSKRDVLEALELTERFDAVLRLPTITKADEMARVLSEIEVPSIITLPSRR